MDFSYTPIELRCDSLNMDYFLVPWDTEILGRPVAEISRIEVLDLEKVKSVYAHFEQWREVQNVEFCSCRIKQSRLAELFFLQQQNFRFIELNYNAVFHNLQQQQLSGDSVEIAMAQEEDRECLVQMAAKTFRHGRFHQDILLGETIGNERYRVWLRNSFLRSSQHTFKCTIDSEIVGFFVVEYYGDKQCNWSLVGLAPGFEGQGLGTRVWKAMMRFHQTEGVDSIVTSISSHNSAVINLYVKLGFRFPDPKVTLHWHR